MSLKPIFFLAGLLLTGQFMVVGCNQKPASSTPTANDIRPAKLPARQPGEAVATLAGGCFWSFQEAFQSLRGVRAVVSGYAGGELENPTYEQVGTDGTGHAESVQVYYNPTIVSYDVLMDAFFAAHDPTTPNQQGPDMGTRYRSIAFYRTSDEKSRIEAAIRRETASGHHRDKVVTEVMPFKGFYPAEVYHQNYYQLHPDEFYIRQVSQPKIAKFRDRMAGKLRSEQGHHHRPDKGLPDPASWVILHPNYAKTSLTVN